MANPGGNGSGERRRRIRQLWALLAFMAAAPAGAQQVSVSATILPPAPAGAGITDLAFGAIRAAPGREVMVEVIPGAAGTGQVAEFEFDVSGANGVSFGLTLPAALTARDGSSLQVRFDDARYGAHCVETPGDACIPVPFAPSAGPLQVCREAGGNESCRPDRAFPRGSVLNVFIGGAVAVQPTQRAGEYAGTITLTIAPW